LFVFSDFDLVLDIVDFSLRVGFKLNIPKIVLSDIRIHPAEDLLSKLLFEVGSSLDERFKAPSNGA
jgi:hypothetical protein